MYISNELSLGTNLINNNDCLHFSQLLWPSSGRTVYIARKNVYIGGGGLTANQKGIIHNNIFILLIEGLA